MTKVLVDQLLASLGLLMIFCHIYPTIKIELIVLSRIYLTKKRFSLRKDNGLGKISTIPFS